MDLILIAILAAAFAPVVALTSPPEVAGIALGLPLVLFFPGYALVAALFPRRHTPEPAERIILSLALSLAVVVLVGLALNYTAWGVRRESVVASLSLFTVAASAAAIAHRRRVPPYERFRLDLTRAAPRRFNPPLLAGIGAAAALAAAAAAAFALLGIPHLGPQGIREEFSEFYLLGANGSTPSLPSALPVGDTATVRLGIVNREESEASYRVSLLINSASALELPVVRLRPGERWEGAASFALSRSEPRQRIEFVLRRDGRRPPYRTLHLWVDGLEPRPLNALAGTTAPVAEGTARAPAPVAPTPPGPRVHVVSPGENMTLIARAYGFALNALLAVNDLKDPDLIYPGQQITIPAVAGAEGQ